MKEKIIKLIKAWKEAIYFALGGIFATHVLLDPEFRSISLSNQGFGYAIGAEIGFIIFTIVLFSLVYWVTGEDEQ